MSLKLHSEMLLDCSPNKHLNDTLKICKALLLYAMIILSGHIVCLSSQNRIRIHETDSTLMHTMCSYSKKKNYSACKLGETWATLFVTMGLKLDNNNTFQPHGISKFSEKWCATQGSALFMRIYCLTVLNQQLQKFHTTIKPFIKATETLRKKTTTTCTGIWAVCKHFTSTPVRNIFGAFNDHT